MAEPLGPGTVLSERFVIESVLGSGGFSIVYLANDEARSDRVVVKELAPSGSQRTPAGVMDLGTEAHQLRRKFMEEGVLQQKLKVPGLVPVRCWFSENGTAYLVSEFLSDARTLDAILREQGRLAVDQALIYFYSLLEIVEAIHGKGLLHRDIKPSNILVEDSDDARVWLIDFGAAREWQSDAHTQTVLFTPGFAPPEQLSEKAKRGPATDIYALCATLYQMLLDVPPPPVADRAAGVEPDLSGVESVAGKRVARAVGLGLSLKMGDRPQSVHELRQLLRGEDGGELTHDLETLDDLIHRSQHFSYRRRQCPACGGVLTEPHPLKRGVCPVCREGRIEHREIHAKLCPVCRSGVLHWHENGTPPYVCDTCGLGILRYRRPGLLSGERVSTCPKCGTVEQYTKSGERITTERGTTSGSPDSDSGGPSATAAQPLSSARKVGELANRERGIETNLRNSPGFLPGITRSAAVWACDTCEAQFDQQPDTRLKQIVPPPTKWTSLYPDEWARVAVGLDPGAGNAECSNCGAEYYVDGQDVTLLGTHHDPNGFAADYEGRRLQLEDLRWLGVGKTSPHRGFVCEDCGAEFDLAGDCLLLVHCKNRRLCSHTEECRTLEEWHRVAEGLPPAEEVVSLEAAVPEALRQSYFRGEVGFEGRSELLWKGPAVRFDSDQESTLTVDLDEVSFGSLLRKWKARTRDLVRCEADADSVTLSIRGEEQPIRFHLHAMDLTAHLKSGGYTVTLVAEDLCQRLSAKQPKSSRDV